MRGRPGPAELQTKVREDFTITEKARTKASSWLKAPMNAFNFKTLLRHSDCEIFANLSLKLYYQAVVFVIILSSDHNGHSDNVSGCSYKDPGRGEEE